MLALAVSFLVSLFALLTAWEAFPFTTPEYVIGFGFSIFWLLFSFFFWAIFWPMEPVVVDPAPLLPWSLLNISVRPSIALESHSSSFFCRLWICLL
jgi:hypothetical protein